MEDKAILKLKEKAYALFPGKNSIGRYLEKVALEPIVFLDSNTKLLINALNLKQ